MEANLKIHIITVLLAVALNAIRPEALHKIRSKSSLPFKLFKAVSEVTVESVKRLSRNSESLTVKIPSMLTFKLRNQ